MQGNWMAKTSGLLPLLAWLSAWSQSPRNVDCTTLGHDLCQERIAFMVSLTQIGPQ